MARLFRRYSDDSADHEGSVFGVGGFVGPLDAWKKLEPEWLAALPEGIAYFHATDCFTGNNQFEFRKGFSLDRRKSLLDRLTDLICGTETRVVGHAVDVPYYVRLAPNKLAGC